jgi:hypothetical protein
MMQVRSLGVSDHSLYEIWIFDDIDTDFYTVRAEETGAAMIQLMFDPEPDSHGITSHAALLSVRKYGPVHKAALPPGSEKISDRVISPDAQAVRLIF